MATSSDVVSCLIQAVANTSTLVFLSLSVHWNAKGPSFFPLHAAVGGQYESLFETLDLLAERVRALGSVVPVSLSGFEVMAGMPFMGVLQSADDMVKVLVQAHEKNVGDLKVLAATAKGAGDAVTENMVLGILEAEDKILWQLKSHLGM
jgi:starvation-inducible DNA-binding protein